MSTHRSRGEQPETIVMTDARIFVAGHRGLVGSAIVRNLLARGVRPDQLILRTHAELELPDGRAVVSWPPVRPSGVDEFDRNCADAIRRAAPFPPIPAELGLTSVRIRAPFAANNPIVK